MLVGTALRRAKLSSARLSGELLTVSPQLALTTPINFVDRVWSLRAETRSTAPIRVKTIKWSKLSRARQPSRPVFSWGAGGRITYPVMGRLGLSLGRTVWVARQLGLTRVMLPPPLAVIDAARAFDQPLPDRCWETWLMAAELPAPAGMRHPVPTM